MLLNKLKELFRIYILAKEPITQKSFQDITDSLQNTIHSFIESKKELSTTDIENIKQVLEIVHTLKKVK